MSSLRPTWVEVDLDAIAHNVRAFAALGSQVMAVVKADGYGHGDVAVARAALDAGATWVGVALVEEGLALRDAGIEAPDPRAVRVPARLRDRRGRGVAHPDAVFR